MRWYLLSLQLFCVALITTIVAMTDCSGSAVVADTPEPTTPGIPAPSSGISSEDSRALGTPMTTHFAAYTVADTIDHEYHKAHSQKGFFTADGTDALRVPYGLAGPREYLGRRVLIEIPGFPPYDTPRIWRIDDTGGTLRRRFKETGIMQLELRFPPRQREDALRLGRRVSTIILLPD